MEKYITIATFGDSFNANLCKAKLEDAGIECILTDENIISIQPFYSNAVGGIKLQVREKDVEMANAILNDSSDEQE